MKGSLVFIIEEEAKIKSEIDGIRNRITSLAAEEAAIKAVATGNEQEVSEELTAMRQELAKWSEIESISSTETSLKNVRGEIKKRKDKISFLEDQSKSFARLTEIEEERKKLVIKYHSLAESFTDVCFAAKEAYELNRKENEELARIIESELKEIQVSTNSAPTGTQISPIFHETTDEITDDSSSQTESTAEDNENTSVPTSSEEQENRGDVPVETAVVEEVARSSAVRTPLDVIYDYMADFDKLYKEATGISETVEEYEAGYQFLFGRVLINRDDANLFKEAAISEEPFMGLTPNERKTLLWALPKEFLKRAGLYCIIDARANGSKDYTKDSLNKFRPKFTFSFVADLMCVVNTGIEEDILSFFNENTDSYEKSKKFGFPKPVEKALPKVS